MRGFTAALAAASILIAAMAPAKPARAPSLAPRPADPAMLDRDAVGAERAAIIVSLWPVARCLVASRHALADQPVVLGRVLAAQSGARAMQGRLAAHFGAPVRAVAALPALARAA